MIKYWPHKIFSYGPHKNLLRSNFKARHSIPKKELANIFYLNFSIIHFSYLKPFTDYLSSLRHSSLNSSNRDGKSKKGPSTRFSPVTSTDVGIVPQNISFNLFASLVWRFKVTPTITHKISETNCSFQVNSAQREKFNFYFLRVFL